MNNFKKIGGVAALIEAATFVVGIVFFIFVLDYSGVVDPAQKVALLVDNQAIMYIMNLLIYVVFGGFLVVLLLSLYERLKAGSPAIVQTATAFGLIWAVLMFASGMVANVGTGVVVDLFGKDPAQAVTVWMAIDPVIEGLGGGNEIVGGLWILLLSWAALRAKGLPTVLNYFGMVIGLAGVISAVPALGDLGGAVFGLGAIVWFVWVGIIMLHSRPNSAS